MNAELWLGLRVFDEQPSEVHDSLAAMADNHGWPIKLIHTEGIGTAGVWAAMLLTVPGQRALVRAREAVQRIWPTASTDVGPAWPDEDSPFRFRRTEAV